MMEAELKNPEYEYAYIHIPKTAGSSMQEALKDNAKIRFCPHGVVLDNIKNLKQITTIREPVDRFSSAFFYLKMSKRNMDKNIYNTPEELLQDLLNLNVEAMKFMKIHDGIHTVNRKPLPTDWVFTRQSDWIFDPHRVMIFENLADEIAKLNDELGTNIILPHYNRSRKVEFEYSESSLDLLKLIYRKDFELYKKYTNVL